VRLGGQQTSGTRTGSPEDDRQAIARVGSSAAMNQGMQVLSYLISGVLCYGALGWLGDHLLGTGFLLPVGIVAGAGLGIYVIIRRFGQPGEQTTTTDETKGTM
jgi:ATP synthase protein I